MNIGGIILAIIGIVISMGFGFTLLILGMMIREWDWY